MNFFYQLNSQRQEQNSSSFNSQKENSMQAHNLKANHVNNGVKAQVIAKLADAQKSDETKKTEVVTLTKQPSFSRTLEAYSDCV